MENCPQPLGKHNFISAVQLGEFDGLIATL